MSEPGGDYWRVLQGIAVAPGLSRDEVWMLTVLADYQGTNPYAYASVRTYAKVINKHRRDTWRLIDRLIKKGWLERGPVGPNRVVPLRVSDEKARTSQAYFKALKLKLRRSGGGMGAATYRDKKGASGGMGGHPSGGMGAALRNKGKV
jgi:hypothetical protein